MKREAVRCNRCRMIIDLTIPHHLTSCRCGDLFVKYHLLNNGFEIEGNHETLWSYDEWDE